MRKHQTITILFLLLTGSCVGQEITFSHLNTSNGLSDNNAQCLAIDKNGFLWIGTTDGLNEYDGYNITTYSRAGQEGLRSDTIRQMICDSRNRIWLTHPGRVSWLDDEKQFHLLRLADNNTRIVCRAIFETSAYGIVLFTPDGHFRYNEQKKVCEKIDWVSQLIGDNEYNTVVPFSANRAVYVFEQRILLVDFSLKKIIFEKDFSHAVTACMINDRRLAVASRDGNVAIFDIVTGNQIKSWQIFNETGGTKSSPRISEMRMAADGTIVIASSISGLVRIDNAGTIFSFRHNALDPNSIATDLLYRVFTGPGGEVIAGAINSGISICNFNNKKAQYKRIFRDDRGNIFDGHPNEMAEDTAGNLWIGSFDRLIKWDQEKNQSTFYPYYYNDLFFGPRNLEIRTLCIDDQQRIWVGAIGAGVALFNRQTGKYQLISDTSLGGALSDTYVNDLMQSSDGRIWACTYRGLYTIDPIKFSIRKYDDHPLLHELANKVVISLYEDRDKRIWIGTQRFGVYCYDELHHKLLHFTIENGLISNTGYAITGDKAGYIYIADNNGFAVMDSTGNFKQFTRTTGMRYHRAESIVVDDAGNAWIANNKCIVKYIPGKNRVEYYEENAGISTDGFRFTAVCKGSDGRLYFGTHRGVNYFNPADLKNYSAQLKVHINQVALPDSLIRFSNSPVIKLRFAENSVQFYFAAINLTGSRHIAYQYMLEGFDKNWQAGTDIHFARYASLSPGNYVFRLKASIDRVNWTMSANQVSIHIVPPFWRKWWFIVLSILLLAAILFSVVQFRINRVRYKERLKTVYNKKISETEMKALRAQMNPHFIFNSLNSINKYILKNDHANASRYLTRFAKLIRLILDNSNSKEVALSNELEALKLYIEMEALRFTNKFSYEIIVDEELSPDTLQVPPLIIQPYVENAIWHGLLHKESGGFLKVHIKKTSDNMLQCVIEDNGIGRARAKELKSKSAMGTKSLGMKLTEERLNMLNKYASLNASIDILDLATDSGEACGTKVILTIPI